MILANIIYEKNNQRLAQRPIPIMEETERKANAMKISVKLNIDVDLEVSENEVRDIMRDEYARSYNNDRGYNNRRNYNNNRGYNNRGYNNNRCYNNRIEEMVKERVKEAIEQQK
jgi:hypothetical protein